VHVGEAGRNELEGWERTIEPRIHDASYVIQCVPNGLDLIQLDLAHCSMGISVILISQVVVEKN
jgi:hypothetical protein